MVDGDYLMMKSTRPLVGGIIIKNKQGLRPKPRDYTEPYLSTRQCPITMDYHIRQDFNVQTLNCQGVVRRMPSDRD
ncbi:MAG: hypothetical protein ACLTDS_06140 [Bianqueaceae bacterium]